MTLEDSTTYQLILARGEQRDKELGQIAEAQSLILRSGAKRFGPASDILQQTIEAINEHDHLGRIADRLLEAKSWDDLAETK